ncbi:hypothetical protein Tco_1174975 [Tanacetum coccineum]
MDLMHSTPSMYYDYDAHVKGELLVIMKNSQSVNLLIFISNTLIELFNDFGFDRDGILKRPTMYFNLWRYKVVRHRYSNLMIQPEPEGSTQGYPLVSVEVLRDYTHFYRLSHSELVDIEKKENRKWLLKALEDGPYVFRNVTPTGSTIPRLQDVEDLQGDDLLYYDAEMKLTNMILLSFPNEFTNSVVSCKTAPRYVGIVLNDDVHNHSEDPLASAMLLLAQAITQNFSNPTNNRLSASSNTRNQAVVHGDRVNIQSRISGNIGRNNRRAYVQGEVVDRMNATNETANVQRIVRTPTPGNTSMGQCYNCGGMEILREFSQPRVRVSIVISWRANVVGQNRMKRVEFFLMSRMDFLLRDASRMGKKLEELNFAQKVQQQNETLTSQIEMYKERNRVLENITKDNNYLKEFLEADERAKRFQKQADSQLYRDREIIRDLEKQRDELSQEVKHFKQKNEELQQSQLILKRKMSENEDKYHDTILDLEEKLKKNVDMFLKIGNSLQAMFD